MTNLEFYKEKVEEYLGGTDNLYTALLSTMVKYSNGIHYDRTLIGPHEVLNWLCEEHEDFILTNKEREFISKLKELHNITSICLTPEHETIQSIDENSPNVWIYTSRTWTNLIGYIKETPVMEIKVPSELMFGRVPRYATHTLQDLGL